MRHSDNFPFFNKRKKGVSTYTHIISFPLPQKRGQMQASLEASDHYNLGKENLDQIWSKLLPQKYSMQLQPNCVFSSMFYIQGISLENTPLFLICSKCISPGTMHYGLLTTFSSASDKDSFIAFSDGAQLVDLCIQEHFYFLKDTQFLGKSSQSTANYASGCNYTTATVISFWSRWTIAGPLEISWSEAIMKPFSCFKRMFSFLHLTQKT